MRRDDDNTGSSQTCSEAADPGDERVTIWVQGNEGWEDRTINLDAIRRRLAGTDPQPRGNTLVDVIRHRLEDITRAKARGLRWREISDVLWESGVSIDPDLLRKYVFRVRRERRIVKKSRAKIY